MTIQLEYETDQKLDMPWEELVRTVIAAALEEIGCPFEAEVSVVLTDDAEIHRINREFRQIDRATDVLSFPMLEFVRPGDFSHAEEEFADCFNPESGELMLGDIMISVDRVKEQAVRYGHSVRRELAFLVAHSMYHLFGFDHMDETEAAAMEEKQRNLLTQLNINR